MEETKDRLIYIDMVKGFSMICIILGHLFSRNYILQCIVCSFHVPIYYIVSGILMNYHENKKGKEKLLKTIESTIKNLIIPYIFFSIIAILYMAVQSNFNYEYILKAIMITIKLGGIGALWFIPTLVIAKFIFATIFKIKNRPMQIIVIVIITLIFFIQPQLPTRNMEFVLYRSFAGVLFMAIGYYCGGKIQKMKVPTVILIIALALAFFIACYNGPLALYTLTNCTILSLFLAVVISFCIILLFQKIPNKKILSMIGKNSLIILGTHQMLSLIVLNLLNQL